MSRLEVYVLVLALVQAEERVEDAHAETAMTSRGTTAVYIEKELTIVRWQRETNACFECRDVRVGHLRTSVLHWGPFKNHI